MAIYGIGAYYGGDRGDVSGDFITAEIAGVGWDSQEAPELHNFVRSLKVGDIIYIKAFSPSSSDLVVRGIGLIRDDVLVDSSSSNGLVQAGRNIDWKFTNEFRIPKPAERNNVRANTLYEEFHPDVTSAIISRLR